MVDCPCLIPFLREVVMEWILVLTLELSRIASRPVVPELDGRPTRIELVRPEDRPTRQERPRR